MHILPFGTEQYFAQYEFNTPYLLCPSDCQSMTVAELLELSGVSAAEMGGVWLGYSESQGSPALRALIAGTYQGVGAEEVVVLAAPEEGIFTAFHTLLQPGDEVVVLTPAYDSLRQLAGHIAGSDHVKQWAVRPTADGWQLDLGRLEALLTPQTRLLVVNFPHNPTGLLPTLAQFEEIIALCRRHGTWLFCDEMYRGLELSPHLRLPSAADLYERAIVLAGLSKVHGLPGLRCGWLVLKDRAMRQALINWKHYTTICAPAPSEFLATVALQVEEALAARSREIVAANVAAAGSFFRRWPGLFRWRRPQAGSVALVGLEVPSATVYCRQLAQDAGILLLPGPFLGGNDQQVRFGFGRRDFQANLARYEAYLAT